MTRSADRRRRALDPDEHALWSKAMGDVKPLRAPRVKRVIEPKRETPTPPPPQQPVGIHWMPTGARCAPGRFAPGEGETRLAPSERSNLGKQGKSSLPPPERSDWGRVGVGAAPPAPRIPNVLGIDKNTLAKLKRGDLAIDGRLDLHGMTQALAHETLDRFIDGAVGRGARLLLIITGKGVGGDGVLRAMLPRWLRAGPHATRILRIEPAHLKHGGAGAWYVYLRRRRD